MADENKKKTASRPKRGLGKGLNVLFGETGYEPEQQASEQKEMPESTDKSETTVKISSIIANEKQPRKNFDEEELLQLTESIKQYGVLQPLLVKKDGEYYRIIAGERRYRAAKEAGLKEIPVVVRDYTSQQAAEINNQECPTEPTKRCIAQNLDTRHVCRTRSWANVTASIEEVTTVWHHYCAVASQQRVAGQRSPHVGDSIIDENVLLIVMPLGWLLQIFVPRPFGQFVSHGIFAVPHLKFKVRAVHFHLESLCIHSSHQHDERMSNGGSTGAGCRTSVERQVPFEMSPFECTQIQRISVLMK